MTLPPLRERKEDIPALVDFFVKQISFTLNRVVKSVGAGFYHKLMTYDWPGNIRELKNAVHHAVAIMEGETLHEEHLSSFFKHIDQGKELFSKDNFQRSLSEIEREAIKTTLNFTRGNKRKAAKILGIGRATLHRKLKGYNL